MRFEDLSPEDQRLLQTDLGSFEKEAQAHLQLCNEMYETGFSKLAAETADNFDAMLSKTAEAEVEEVSMDPASEKLAAELGSFIERGFFDGLRKLGQDRHGDEAFYIYPFLEEKVAAGAAGAAKAWLGNKWQALKGVAGKASEKAKALPGQAAEYHKGIKEHAVKGTAAAGRALDWRKTLGAKRRAELAGEAAKEYGKAGLKSAPHAAVLAAGGWGLNKALKKKED